MPSPRLVHLHNSISHGSMTSAEASDAEIPKALLKRLIKAKLSNLPGADPTRDYQVNKDALLAFQEAAKTFIHYLTATANDVCRSGKRQTISAEDVIVALTDIDFPELVPELQLALEGKG
ncbi:hypothetical protein QBZ16_005093 [Prototheca wickerhamii]|uniref:Core Histone H2A/H2B/H3 domain-containing protein n=1 Tax=Prototheca wickerhamii TaxID=3111 RepID=A0AAD9IEJ6_PROWI|nr:hypothetical protein QBZ16_005093 [Prototheca wickerhamii]